VRRASFLSCSIFSSSFATYSQITNFNIITTAISIGRLLDVIVLN
jgi:hypothetical protein